MSASDRRAVTTSAVATIAMAGLLGIGGTLAFPAIAGAEPSPAPPAPEIPAPEAAPPPQATIGAPLAQSGVPNGPGLFGLPDMSDPGSLLGQNPAPAAPGGPPPVQPTMTLNNAYLLPQNVVPSAPGQGAVAGVAPGQENADTNPLDYIRRLHEANISGGLVGIGFGNRSQEQLGQPLPGTAPAPGIPIPPGLGEDLPAPRPIDPPIPPAG